jgi:hypothetical protein
LAKKEIHYSFPNNKTEKEYKVVVNRCDICNDRIECKDNIENQIDLLDELDNSYESEADRSTYYDGPKLLLCGYCTKEYLLPGYPLQ